MTTSSEPKPGRLTDRVLDQIAQGRCHHGCTAADHAAQMVDEIRHLRMRLADERAGHDEAIGQRDQLRAERDELRARIGNARAEIRKQDLAAQLAPHDAAIVSDALAEVETHLVDPEYRPAPGFTALVDQTAPSPAATAAVAQIHRDVAAVRRGEDVEGDRD